MIALVAEGQLSVCGGDAFSDRVAARASAWRNFVASTYEMIETFESDNVTSSGRSRSKRSVGRLSRSLTNASNSLKVFASMAFMTTEEVGTRSFLSEAMS